MLHAHALQKMREGDHERLEVAASRASKYVAGEGWHTDVSCDEEPPKLSMLFIDKSPDIGLGGDTLFANMYLAYEMLSPALLEMLYRTIEMTPALTFRVRWTPRTMVLWDNRCTQHHALWDYYPLERHGFRVSVLGERPSR